jgi:uncharacterized membrane protein YsdA (DUF1294 family)
MLHCHDQPLFHHPLAKPSFGIVLLTLGVFMLNMVFLITKGTLDIFCVHLHQLL